jgi:hypothetical protein
VGRDSAASRGLWPFRNQGNMFRCLGGSMTAVRTGLGPVGGRHTECACYVGHRTRSVRATDLGPVLTLALSQRKVGPRLGGTAQRTSLRRHRDEALQERGRGDYEHTDARSRARWHKPCFLPLAIVGFSIQMYEASSRFLFGHPEDERSAVSDQLSGGWTLVRTRPS